MQMSRRFEQSFKLLLGRSAEKITYGALGLTLIFSIIKGTFVYFGELAFTSAMLLISRNRVLNLRRILAISSLTVAIAAMMELVLFRPPFSLFLMVPSITSLVLLSLSPGSYMYIVPFLASAIIYSKISERAVAGSFILLMGIIAVKLFAKKLAFGEDPFLLFSSFVQSLFGNTNSFEDIMSKHSEEKTFRLPIFKIEGNPPVLIMVSDIHPGPFKNVSGAKLIEMLRSAAKEKGYELVFLHGTGGHENDPSSINEVNKVVSALQSSLEEGKWIPCMGEGMEPFSLSSSDVRISGFSFGSCPPLILVSRKKSSMDDIPEEVVKGLGEVPGILVDAQNRFDGEIDWGPGTIEELKELLSKIPNKRCEPEIGFSRVPQEELDPSGREIGPLGMAVLSIRCREKRGAFVVIDGNNMAEEARSSLESTAKEMGYGVVEIATTDNHENTGGAKGRGYRVVGESIPPSLLANKLAAALRSSETSSCRRIVWFSSLDVKIKVLGKEGFGLFQRIVENLGSFGILFGLYILLAVIVSLTF